MNTEAINATTNTATKIFVTFHEAFAYFAKQYNVTQLSILGPFEEEPTPTDIQNVITAINQYHLKYVGYESLENPAISQSISSQTNATLINMNPIEGLDNSGKSRRRQLHYSNATGHSNHSFGVEYCWQLNQ